VVAQRVCKRRHERQGPPGAWVLRPAHRRAAVEELEGSGNGDRVVGEVDILPAQAQHLALAEAERERHQPERLKAVPLRSRKQLARLCRGQDGCLVRLDLGRLHFQHHIARRQIPSNGDVERVSEHLARALNRGRLVSRRAVVLVLIAERAEQCWMCWGASLASCTCPMCRVMRAIASR